jgi:hypothetical protein
MSSIVSPPTHANSFVINTAEINRHSLAPEQWAQANAALVMLYELGDAKELEWRLFSSPTSELQRWLHGQLISVPVGGIQFKESRSL